MADKNDIPPNNDKNDLMFLLSQLAQTTGTQQKEVSAISHPTTNVSYNQVQGNNAPRTTVAVAPAPKKNFQSSELISGPVKADDSIFRIDPTKITKYSDAIKYIVFVLLRNDNFQLVDQIKALITEQQLKEEEWYREYESLKEKQQLRKSGQEELTNLLNKIQGKSAIDTKDSSNNQANADDEEKRNQLELERFEMKIYNQFSELSKRTASQLADLKIPLFCIDPKLMTEQVFEHQTKLLDFLQDLCHD